MLVRFVEAFRRGETVFSPGETLDVSEDEAAVLIEAGTVVPVTTRDPEPAAEWR